MSEEQKKKVKVGSKYGAIATAGAIGLDIIQFLTVGDGLALVKMVSALIGVFNG